MTEARPSGFDEEINPVDDFERIEKASEEITRGITAEVDTLQPPTELLKNISAQFHERLLGCNRISESLEEKRAFDHKTIQLDLDRKREVINAEKLRLTGKLCQLNAEIEQQDALLFEADEWAMRTLETIDAKCDQEVAANAIIQNQMFAALSVAAKGDHDFIDVKTRE